MHTQIHDHLRILGIALSMVALCGVVAPLATAYAYDCNAQGFPCGGTCVLPGGTIWDYYNCNDILGYVVKTWTCTGTDSNCNGNSGPYTSYGCAYNQWGLGCCDPKPCDGGDGDGDGCTSPCGATCFPDCACSVSADGRFVLDQEHLIALPRYSSADQLIDPETNLPCSAAYAKAWDDNDPAGRTSDQTTPAGHADIGVYFVLYGLPFFTAILGIAFAARRYRFVFVPIRRRRTR